MEYGVLTRKSVSLIFKPVQGADQVSHASCQTRNFYELISMNKP